MLCGSLSPFQPFTLVQPQTQPPHTHLTLCTPTPHYSLGLFLRDLMPCCFLPPQPPLPHHKEHHPHFHCLHSCPLLLSMVAYEVLRHIVVHIALQYTLSNIRTSTSYLVACFPCDYQSTCVSFLGQFLAKCPS